jgi:outer membrane protein insertion porin family
MVRGMTNSRNSDDRCEYAKRGMPSVDPRGALNALANTFGRRPKGSSHKRAGRSEPASENWAIRIRNRIDRVVQAVAKQDENSLGCTSIEDRSRSNRHPGVLRRSRSLLASISSSFPSSNGSGRGEEKTEQQAGVAPSSSPDSSETSDGGDSNAAKRKEEKEKGASKGDLPNKEAAPGPEILGFSRIGQSAVEDSGKAKDAAEKDSGQTQERILVSEIEVKGASPELTKLAQQSLVMKPNFAYTLNEVSEDVNRVFSTGFFSTCHPVAEDTRDGVRLTIEVKENPKLTGVVATGADMLPQSLIEEAFEHQYGKTLNFQGFGRALGQLNKWYEDKGILGQVTGADMKGNVAELKMKEARVSRVSLRFLNPETGEPCVGKTNPDVIMKNITIKPGQVYNVRQCKTDIDVVHAMGLFDDVNIVPQPAEDSSQESDQPKVVLTLNVVERKTGGFSAGGGISASQSSDGPVPGFVGSCAYSQRNLFGLNQKLTASLEIGQADSLFRINHSDPWVGSDKHRTGRNIYLQNMRTSGNAIHGKAVDEVGSDGASVTRLDGLGEGATSRTGDQDQGGILIGKLLGGIEYSRPLSTSLSGTAGIQYQRTRILGENGQPIVNDYYGNPIIFSHKDYDEMLIGSLRSVYSGNQSQLVMSMEQAIPVKQDFLNFNRLRVRAEKTIKAGFSRLVVTGKGGMIIGDLPPYEAFSIGGTNSVRGYGEGSVGTGRYYVVGSSELHFPLFSPLEGALFADYGSDIDSGPTVMGDPAGCRGKPGSGYGLGVGVRVDSPVGPLRLEYAWNDKKTGRFHFGIGYHG